ncbi:MAG: hypothetical protein NVS9B1_02330 [Candidatus Dormibacteraceae bacterium]
MRPTWRLLGAGLLGAVVYLYGATSEVAWLFLFAFLIWGAAVSMFFYARWNADGLTGGMSLLSVASSDASPVSDIPERDFRDAPLPAPVFEGDILRLRLRLGVGDGHARGPARLSVGVAGDRLEAGTGIIPAAGWSAEREYGPVSRGPIGAGPALIESADPLGLFRVRAMHPPAALAVALPLFASLTDNVHVREIESQLTVVRAGHGSDLYGVREYRPGDPLRRIHWRTSARRGELVVREFEPPGLRVLALLMEPAPGDRRAADQLARLAASEAWDCIRFGGRVTAWSPGRELLPADRGNSIWNVLEWLARWPGDDAADPEVPRVMDVIAFTDRAGGEAEAAATDLQARGASARAWLVGEGELDLPFTRAELDWPLPR